LRIVANLSNPEFFDIPLTAIRVGDLVFGGVPGEPFQQIGRNVKERSPFSMTFVTCCTNGSHGYFPTEEAFAEKGYERSTSRFASNCATIVSDGLTQAINSLFENSDQ